MSEATYSSYLRLHSVEWTNSSMSSFNLCSRESASVRYVALPALHTFLVVGSDVGLFNLVNNICKTCSILLFQVARLEVEMPKGIKCRIGDSPSLEVSK